MKRELALELEDEDLMMIRSREAFSSKNYLLGRVLTAE